MKLLIALILVAAGLLVNHLVQKRLEGRKFIIRNLVRFVCYVVTIKLIKLMLHGYFISPDFVKIDRMNKQGESIATGNTENNDGVFGVYFLNNLVYGSNGYEEKLEETQPVKEGEL